MGDKININDIKKEIYNLTKDMNMKELKKTVLYRQLPQGLRKSYKKTKEDLLDIMLEYIILCEEVKYLNTKYPEYSIQNLNKFCRIDKIQIEEKKLEEEVKDKSYKSFMKRLLIKMKKLFKI